MGNMVLSQEFYETDAKKGFIRGYTYHIVRSNRSGADGTRDAYAACSMGGSTP